ncbi:MAG TPA: hypothetical protein VGG84_00865 [Gemmatimonadaceae bacterium]
MSTAQQLTTVTTLGAAPTNLYAQKLLELGLDPVIRLFSPSSRLIWNIGGPTAPIAGAESGMVLNQFSGFNAPFHLFDLQGARQNGVTNTGKAFDAAEVDMVLELSAGPGAETRRVLRWWIETWAGNRVSRLNYWTPELGDWWLWVRQFKPVTNQFKLSYAQSGQLELPWAARGDDAFWLSYDSVDTFDGATAGSGNGNGYVSLVQRGTEAGQPRYLVYGPGTFSLGDCTSGRSVTFGPILPGQVFLISTLDRLPVVIDVTPADTPVPAQNLTDVQKLLQYIISFVTNNNVPPLLQELESVFGIQPPQGNPLSLIANRFKASIPGLEESQGPFTTHIPVSITGGTAGKSKIVGALTPMRTWPE